MTASMSTNASLRAEDGSPYISLAEAAAIVPGRPAVGTIWRWARRGIRSQTGSKIRLRHVRVGGRIYTTETWLRDFFDASVGTDISTSRVAYPNRSEAS